MRKTFLLVACAPYTEGTMLIVVDSIEEWKRMCQEYYQMKYEALKDYDFYKYLGRRSAIPQGQSWSEMVSERNDAIQRFKDTFNNKPYDFEFDTGFWMIWKEFMSDLPPGTHYLGDYCA